MKRHLPLPVTPNPQGSMTALIDVVFLLLIFFMTVTQFRSAEGVLRAFMPRDAGLSVADHEVFQRSCRVVLALDTEGNLLVFADERAIPTNTWGDFERKRSGRPGFDVDALEAHLSRRLETHTGLEPLSVVIDFAERVPYLYVIQVLNACRALDIDDVRMAIPTAP